MAPFIRGPFALGSSPLTIALTVLQLLLCAPFMCRHNISQIHLSAILLGLSMDYCNDKSCLKLLLLRFLLRFLLSRGGEKISMAFSAILACDKGICTHFFSFKII